MRIYNYMNKCWLGGSNHKFGFDGSKMSQLSLHVSSWMKALSSHIGPKIDKLICEAEVKKQLNLSFLPANVYHDYQFQVLQGSLMKIFCQISLVSRMGQLSLNLIEFWTLCHRGQRYLRCLQAPASLNFKLVYLIYGNKQHAFYRNLYGTSGFHLEPCIVAAILYL